MDIKELLNDSKGMSIDELIEYFKDDITEELFSLCESGEVFKNNKGKYILSEKYHLYKYSVKRILPRFAILFNGEKEVKIDIDELNGAIYKDDVLYNEKEGYIFKIIKHNLDNIIGVYKRGFVYPNDENFDRFKTTDRSPKYNDLVLIDGKIDKNGELICKIKKIIGKSEQADSEAKALILDSEVPYKFPRDVLNEANAIEDEVNLEELKGRVSYLDDVVMTLDGVDTKDIDDAFSISKEKDLFHLKVHIADVSHYVTKGSKIDEEAISRGTSIYLSKEVITMLPRKLSNGICSLNEGVIRLTLTCDMKINNLGEVVDYSINPSYIKSYKKLNYDDVNKYIKGEFRFDDKIEKSIDIAVQLSNVLTKNKTERGELELDKQEAKIVYDDNGEVVDVVARKTDKAEKLIEDFMIIANETVASHFYYMDYPLIYRVHAPISEDKLNQFLRIIKPLGYNINAIQNGVHPKEIQALINESKNKENGTVVRDLLLRSLSKAIYSPDNIGHFGLASKIYTHFTSPIRRYPDLLLHRLIHFYLDNSEFDYDELYSYIDELAKSSSIYERRAISLERKELDLRLCEFMKGKEDNYYIGSISGMIRSGFFVTLDNMVEGFVKFELIPYDFFTFDEENMLIFNSNEVLKLGDKVKVKVRNISLAHQKIDFMYFGKVGGRKNGKNKHNKRS